MTSVFQYHPFMISLKAQYSQLLTRNGGEGAKKSIWGGSPQGAPSHATNLTSEIVNLILSEAILARTSDIHLEPRTGKIVVRFRIDGKLHDVLEMEESSQVHLMPHIKILANIPTDTASSRKSWDGRFSKEIGSKKFDFRIATFPTLLGDKIAIRILNKDSEIVDLKKIGLGVGDHARLERIVQRKSGLVIVSGPTGGGKTTTLYSILRRLHTPSVNIVTLEDPVEYQIDGINQCDLKNKSNEDFISGLKAVLRQDPDVLLVGEIRDAESAEIALQASITGHLVITSLHANSALGTVVRLINMGLERHVVAYALVGTVAQRLVRRICDGCKVPYRVDANTLNRICVQCGLNPKLFIPTPKPATPPTGGAVHYVTQQEAGQSPTEFTFYKGSGCDQCSNTGYKGRIGIFEVLQITDELKELIIRQAPIPELEAAAVRDGFQTLALDAIGKVKSGLVTIDDIYPILLEKSH